MITQARAPVVQYWCAQSPGFHPCIPNTWELEAEASDVKGRSWLHREFKIRHLDSNSSNTILRIMTAVCCKKLNSAQVPVQWKFSSRQWQD